MLPKGVHRVVWKSGRVAYYWRPGRGTEAAGASTRLPDNPTLPEFWEALETLNAPRAAIKGGVEVMVEAYLASAHFTGLADSTRGEYARYMVLMKEHFGRFAPDDLAPHDIANIRDTFSDKPGMANSLIRAIGAVYAWGIERGHARANPAKGIRKFKGKEWEPWPLEALQAVRDHARREIAAACGLAFYTGQRLGDVLKMQLSHIKGGRIELAQQKTKKRLAVTIHSGLQPLIADLRSKGHIYLVSKDDGRPYTVDQFHAAWGREMVKSGLEIIKAQGLVFHGLRKNATNSLLEAGCTPSEVAAITGMSLHMIEHYSRRVNQERLADAAMAKREAADDA